MRRVLRQPKETAFEPGESGLPKLLRSPSGPVRVSLSTDRAAVVDRLGRYLRDTGGIHLLNSGESGRPAAVLLLDCGSFPPQARLRLQRTARTHHPARVLWLLQETPSANDAIHAVLDAVKIGWCHGYVTDGCALNTVARAIFAVAQHDFWLPRGIVVQALSDTQSLRAAMAPLAPTSPGGNRSRTLLTRRERQVLQLVRAGLTNKEVGRQLGIEEDTVKKHLRNMYAKLGVHRRAQMLIRGVGDGRPSG
jgi:DNA-binding NarL/FixJ family response regulator